MVVYLLVVGCSIVGLLVAIRLVKKTIHNYRIWRAKRLIAEQVRRINEMK